MNDFYLIGLTGNLGSGKSTVRRTLEALGARGLDADALAHVAMRRGTPAWLAIVETFGAEILQPTGRIDRRALGVRVFGDLAALNQLEAILHPAVGALTKEWLRETRAPVAVIEAIKLVEAGMHQWCDALWVVTCAPETQIARVMQSRQLREEDARARLAAQGSLDGKLQLAQVVIDNSGDAAATRAQVEQAWRAIRPETARDKHEWLWGVPALPTQPPAPTPPSETPPAQVVSAPPPIQPAPAPAGSVELQVRRSRRGDLDALGVALAQAENRAQPLSRDESLKRFGERGYRIAIRDKHIIALAAWEAENLVAIVREVWAESTLAAWDALPRLFALIEAEARDLLCEVVVLLIASTAPPYVAEQTQAAGYHREELNALHPVWRQVTQDRLQTGDGIWLKRLREEMITKPI